MGETYRVTSTPGPAVDRRYSVWMGQALDVASRALASGDVPVGALVLSPEGELLGAGHNLREAEGDPTAHAEVVAIRAAASAALSSGGWRLEDCTLVVTLEPCVMCAGALMLARIGRLVLGAWDPKAGACGSVWDLVRDRRATHRVEVIGGVREQECSQILLDFFAGHRL
jgi:tRNA(adenine34) deaminase